MLYKEEKLIKSSFSILGHTLNESKNILVLKSTLHSMPLISIIILIKWLKLILIFM